jgi:hypothetical protein
MVPKVRSGGLPHQSPRHRGELACLPVWTAHPAGGLQQICNCPGCMAWLSIIHAAGQLTSTRLHCPAGDYCVRGAGGRSTASILNTLEVHKRGGY